MNPLNGLLLIDKPSGLTSHDVVHRVRRALGHRGIGHAGTLDPLASGLLVLLIGEATKVSDYILNGDKGYELRVKLGLKTDSMDISGKVLKEMKPDVSESRIREAVARLSGTLELEVPVHSAVKVDGKRLYEFAHKGERPESVPSREMRFYDLEVVGLSPTHVDVRMKCSKGSFVRAWANRLGDDLGCGACVEKLRRVYSEPFKAATSIGLTELENRWDVRKERHGREIGPAWIPLKDALPHFARVFVEGQDETLLKNGQISGALRAELMRLITAGEAPPPVRVISRESDDLVAILLHEPGSFYRIKRVFHRV